MKRKMPPAKKNNLPQMPADTGFGIGFFCGVLLGAVGVYLIVTPEGQKLKKNLTADFLKHQQTFILESVIPRDEKAVNSKTSLATNIHSLIAKAKKYLEQPKTTSIQKEPNKSTKPKKKHVFKKK